ncbi:MAG: hypothetical protein J4O00_03670, partial [Chloroflexi bacterium]|nr:hypothetical protein [Chloroflexota bacterium]MCI0883989.1 hypothetical protein [Chloroflexota bacterium]
PGRPVIVFWKRRVWHEMEVEESHFGSSARSLVSYELAPTSVTGSMAQPFYDMPMLLMYVGGS